MDIAKLDLGKPDPERLISRPEWGALNFEEIRQELGLLRAISEQIENIDSSFVPQSILSELQQRREEIESQFKTVGKFSMTVDNPKAVRTEMINAVKGLMGHALTHTVPLLNAVTILGANTAFSRQIEETRSKLVIDALEVQQQIENAKSRLPQIVKEAEEAAAAAKESAARSGVSVHETDFHEEVKSLDKARIWWLIAGGALVVAAMVSAYLLTETTPPNATYMWVAQHLVTKIFIVGSLSAGAVWCGGNYRSLSHLRSVNKHRLNALRTFKTFVAAAETPEIRQAILLETTRTIFGASPTGYLQASESNSDTGSKMAEALTKASKSGSSGS